MSELRDCLLHGGSLVAVHLSDVPVHDENLIRGLVSVDVVVRERRKLYRLRDNASDGVRRLVVFLLQDIDLRCAATNAVLRSRVLTTITGASAGGIELMRCSAENNWDVRKTLARKPRQFEVVIVLRGVAVRCCRRAGSVHPGLIREGSDVARV